MRFQTFIVMTVFILLLAVVLWRNAWSGSIQTTYDTARPEPIGDVMGAITGSISMTYATGGVEWRDVGTKFKRVWAVTFEPARSNTSIVHVRYDREDSKIKAYMASDGSEFITATQLTSTYFTAKGQR